jgi:hypothetical protein
MPGQRVLTLGSGDVTPCARGMFALIDGEDETVDRVHDILDCAFRRGSAADTMVKGGEEEYVAGVFVQIAGAAFCKRRSAVVLAVWMDREIVVGYLGEGRAYLVREFEGVEITGSPPAAIPITDLYVARVTVAHGDHLVLVNPEGARGVQHLQLCQTVYGSPSLPDAAAWFALQAFAWGGSESSVIVVHLGKVTHAPEIPVDRRHSHLLGLLGSAVAAALICAVAVVAYSMQARGSPALSASSIPVGLRTQQVTASQALLVWRSTPNATGYRIRVGDRRYVSREPRLKLSTGLQAGKDYLWQVQAQFKAHLGPMSRPGVLRVPPLRLLPLLIAVSPRGVYPARLAARIPFCWRGASRARFDLSVVSGSIHLHRSVTYSALSYQGRSLCVTQALPVNASYRWRVGSVAPGYIKSWTPWMQFSIAAPPPPRPARPVRSLSAPTPRPVYRPPAPRPVYRPPTPQPIYRPPAPQPAPQPVVAPTPPPAPVPTSPVHSCPNPPNCR